MPRIVFERRLGYIENMEPAPPRFQYSLWSLVVLTTVVAVLCSIGATTHWSVAIVIIVGIAVCSIGFGPLSYRKHPQAGCVAIFLGFVVRLFGLVLVAFGLVVWLTAGWHRRETSF